jgi:acyl-CoA thioesterase-2
VQASALLGKSRGKRTKDRVTSELIRMLDLKPVERDRYVGQNLAGSQGVVFGGQLLAQSVAAAANSVPDMHVKSMHTIFTRGASPEQPVELDVERLHEGRSFASVEVSIRQGARLCTRSLVLLDNPDPDLMTYCADPPVVSPPDDSVRSAVTRRGWDVHIVGDVDISDPDAVGPPELLVWSRFADVPPAEWVSQALLAYASDGFLIGTAMRPHPGVGQALAHVTIATTVVTQTLTFHDYVDAGDWLLLAHSSPYAGRGRSYGRADVYRTDGGLIASYAQENMIRA